MASEYLKGVTLWSGFFTREVLLTLFLVQLCAGQALAASAITSDGSIGTKITQGGTFFDITGGSRRGANLFHSFGLFSVGEGDTANFLNESGLATSNIIGRVTGRQTSNIFGTIKTTNFGKAGLFLINPAGWLFGPTASLNVGGSFHVSTADYLKFADGAKFHADLAKQSALTTAPVSAFGFLSQSPAGITIRESPLQVPDRETLSLVGGNLDISGGLFGFLSAAGGTVNLASVASSGDVPINLQEFSDSSFARLGDIHLSDFALVTTSGNSAGSVVIRGGRLFVDEGSFIFSNTFGDVSGPPVGIDIAMRDELFVSGSSLLQSVTSGAGDAGDIQLKASRVTIDASVVTAQSEGSGQGGNISVEADSLAVQNGSVLSSGAFGTGPGGSISLNANESVSFSGGSGISSGSEGPGSAGTVNIQSPLVILSGEGVIAANADAAGNGGDIRIAAGQLAILDGFGLTSLTTGAGVAGVGGNIDLNATDSIVISGASSNRRSGVFTGTLGDGNSGNISITGPFVLLDGGDIGAFSADAMHLNNQGNSGDISFNVAQLSLQNALISAGVAGITTTGGGGRVTIQASQGVFIDGSSGILNGVSGSGAAGPITIRAPTLVVSGPSGLIESISTGSGPGGIIDIAVDSLQLSDGGVIASGSDGVGSGGTINVTAGNLLISGNGGIFTDSSAAGPAGNINILAKDIKLMQGAQISAESQGVGNTGNINIIATNSLGSVESSITTEAETADGGNINLIIPKLLELTNSQITTSVQGGEGKGGNITIDTQSAVLDHGQIRANAFDGGAGNITLEADNLTLTGGAQIATNTFGAGKGGTITILASDTVALSGGSQNFGEGTGIFAVAEAGSTGRAGDITITAGNIINTQGQVNSSTFGSGDAGRITLQGPTVRVGDGASIATVTSGDGKGGDVTLKAQNLTLTGTELIGTQVRAGTGPDSAGDAGNILMDAGNITIAGNVVVGSDTDGSGKGGSVTLKASDTIRVAGTNGTRLAPVGDPVIAATSGIGNDGDAGNIVLEAKNIELAVGARIDSETFGSGKGGTVRVTASDTILASLAYITTSAFPLSTGDAGNIVLEANNVTLNRGTLVDSGTAGPGKGGDVTLRAQNLTISGSEFANPPCGCGDLVPTQVSANATPFSTGDAGSIVVEATKLTVGDSAQIATNTFGAGKGGTITISGLGSSGIAGLLSNSTNPADNSISISGSGSGIFSRTFGENVGGDIDLHARQITLSNGASIDATSTGVGKAGNILVQADENLAIRNATVTTDSQSAQGGQIALGGKLVEISHGSQVTTSVQSDIGDAGKITIAGHIVKDRSGDTTTFTADVPANFVILDGKILATADQGSGGNIEIVSQVFLASADSETNVASQGGTSGTIDIQAAITDLSGSLAPLPEAVLQATSLLQQSCAARFGGGRVSSLVAGGREGLPFEPGTLMRSSPYRLEAHTPPTTSQKAIEPYFPNFPSMLALVNPLLPSTLGCK